MASEKPTATAAQPKSFSAQQNKRLLIRLTAWGAAAVLWLVAAVVVSLTVSNNKQLQTAFSGTEPRDSATASIVMPSADFAAVKRATQRTAAKLAAVERNTAETRAETKRLALQINKLTADSFRFTGRLANIEHQIGGITGSIKEQAERAAAAAVAKAMPLKPTHNAVFDKPVPAISPPATMLPKLSLIVPPSSMDKATENPDFTITSAITRKPKSGSKDEARVGSKLEAHAKAMTRHGAMTAEADATPNANPMAMAKPKPGAMSLTPAMKATKVTPKKTMTKMASVVVRPARRSYSRHWIPTYGYGVDLGGADSVTVARAQWAAVKANFGPVLAGMRPLVVRNHRLLTTGQYRLVLGRTRSLASAKKLCDRLTLKRMSCQPVEFDKGRMIWR